MDNFNPWDVSSLEVFHLYCCPECDSKHNTKVNFVKHALDCHWNFRKVFEIVSKVVIPRPEPEVNEKDNLIGDPLKIEEDCDDRSEADTETTTPVTIKDELTELDLQEYKCDICCITVVTKSLLIEHIETVHQEKIQGFECDLCGRTFDTKRINRAHRKKMHPESQFFEVNTEVSEDHLLSFKCDYCDFVTYERPKLKIHFNEKHKKGDAFACHLCDNTYMSPYGFEFHLTKEHQIGHFKYKCDECDKPFQSIVHLKKHEKKHSKKQVKCEICSRVCASEGSLRCHMKLHDEMKEKCDHCDEKFKTELKLRYHMKTKHQIFQILSENKVKKCDTCKNEFEDAELLNDHLKVCKNDLKKFKCQDCNNVYVSHLSLEFHYVTFHQKILHCCDICGKAFLEKQAMNRHKKVVHSTKAEHICHLCGFGCTTRIQYDRHLFSKHNIGDPEYKCEHCGKLFLEKHIWKQHVEGVHWTEKAFQCDKCGWAGASKKKLERHMKEKHIRDVVYPCEHCEYKAYRKGWLTAHIKNIHMK